MSRHDLPTGQPEKQSAVDRRTFLSTAAATGAAVAAGSQLAWATPSAPSASDTTPETKVQQLYQSLTPEQRQLICFDWNHIDPRRGLLRTRVANNWQITEGSLNSDAYTGEQRALVREIFEGLIQPEWHERFDQQLTDDAGGFGNEQSIAIFGTPGEDQFEFVLTGRHMTLRCDGNSAEHVAFGGPIFYGHAAEGFREGPQHVGNVFWDQALAANQVYEMLDGRQRTLAEVATTPREQAVGFQGAEGPFPGIPLAELSSDQVGVVQLALGKLLEPYRQSDQNEATQCLTSQGGLAQCSLAFFTDNDIGNDRVWDNFRLEGPSFVWHFRGAPHVHAWIHIADDPTVELNA